MTHLRLINFTLFWYALIHYQNPFIAVGVWVVAVGIEKVVAGVLAL